MPKSDFSLFSSVEETENDLLERFRMQEEIFLVDVFSLLFVKLSARSL
jgi:hypothetical protein